MDTWGYFWHGRLAPFVGPPIFAGGYGFYPSRRQSIDRVPAVLSSSILEQMPRFPEFWSIGRNSLIKLFYDFV
jgi:hypothetical protein